VRHFQCVNRLIAEIIGLSAPGQIESGIPEQAVTLVVGSKPSN